MKSYRCQNKQEKKRNSRDNYEIEIFGRAMWLGLIEMKLQICLLNVIGVVVSAIVFAESKWKQII